MVYDGGRGFEVEFVTFSGDTIAVVTVDAGQIRALGPREIAHAREVA